MKMKFAHNLYNTVSTATMALASAVLTLLSPGHANAQQTIGSVIPVNDPPVVIRWKQYHVLSKADQARLSDIQNAIQSRHTITDADLTFALSKLKSEPLVRQGHNKLELQCMVLTMLVGRKDFTKPQVGRFLQAVVPFAYSNNSTVAGYAAIALGSLRSAQVIPVLEKLARETTRENVRQSASRNLPRLKQLAAAGEI
jgi:HEAT repeat protein